MTKEEMAEGFARGRELNQCQNAEDEEKAALDELIAEGKATLTENWTARCCHTNDGFTEVSLWRTVRGLKLCN